jgi:formylglycine-generating enzyme required for sulfatase activity
VATGPTFNHDAVWVFFKFRTDGGPWRHATLRDFGNFGGFGGQVPPVIEILGGKGAMIYRSDNGTGDVTYNNLEINWDYVEDTGGNTAMAQDVEVRIYAIEMVYIPTADYALGSGPAGPTNFNTIPPSDPQNREVNEFYLYDANVPVSKFSYVVQSENPITVGTQPGNLYYDQQNGNAGNRLDIPGDFPKGYNEFYLQKYETTQQQWVAFFNTLTDAQKLNRDITSSSNGKGTDFPAERNGIGWDDSTPSSDAQITDGQGDEDNKTRDFVALAMNWVSQQDMMAYLDWAALRPMTELEFEKAARGGNNNAVENEYAWGTARITSGPNDIVNNVIFQANENVTNLSYPDPNASPQIGMANWEQAQSPNGAEQGPYRVGIFAASPAPGSGRNRANTGAGFYGNMELSGNLLEGVINVGRQDGVDFTNTMGDGELDANGNANVPTWPTTTEGISIRGGAYSNDDSARLLVSDRFFGVTFSGSNNPGGVNSAHTARRRNLQFRGVRGL